MALRSLVYLGHACLREHTPEFEMTQINESTRTLVQDMIETMYHEEGVGLAATQIGVALRIAVIDVSEEKNNPICLINPKILNAECFEEMHEGCLSIPGAYAQVNRANKVRFEAYDIEGKRYEMDAAGLFAQCIQHELDHLDGRVYIDHVSRLRREMILAKMKKYLRHD